MCSALESTRKVGTLRNTCGCLTFQGVDSDMLVPWWFARTGGSTCSRHILSATHSGLRGFCRIS